jgi:hypothetical protein
MPQYMVLLYDTPESVEQWRRMSAEQIKQGIAEYARWSESVAGRGHLVAGEKLQDGTGRVLRGGRSGRRVTGGPYMEATEIIGGYFVIRAADYEEAVSVLSDCPHLEHGTIEVRQIEPLVEPAVDAAAAG